MTEISEDTARRIKVYPFIKIVEEVKPEVKEEPKVEVKQKKSKKRKDGLSNNN